MLKNTFVFVLLILLFASCHIDRKRYSSGFSFHSLGKIEQSANRDLQIKNVVEPDINIDFNEPIHQNDTGLYTVTSDYGLDSVSKVEKSKDHVYKDEEYLQNVTIDPNDVYIAYNPDKKNHPLATIAFVLAIAGIFIIPFSLLALILGIIALKRIDETPFLYKNRWMALFAIYFGLIYVLLSILSFALVILIIAN